MVPSVLPIKNRLATILKQYNVYVKALITFIFYSLWKFKIIDLPNQDSSSSVIFMILDVSFKRAIISPIIAALQPFGSAFITNAMNICK